MRVFCVLLFTVSSLFAQTQTAAQPSHVATVPTVDRNAFLFTRYDLDVSINTDARSLQVRGSVSLVNGSERPQSQIALQISSTLKWSSVRMHGATLAFTPRQLASDIDHTGFVNEAVVTLPRPVPPKETRQIEVAYQGTIPLSAARLQRVGAPADVAQHSDWDVLGQSYSAFRGFGNVAWYPVALEPVALGQGNELFRAVGEFKQRNPGTLHVHLTVRGNNGEQKLTLLHSGTATPVLSPGSTDIDFPLGPSTVPLIAIGGYIAESSPSAEIAYLTTDAASTLYGDVATTTSKFVTDLLGPAKQKIQLIQNADAKSVSFESGATLITPMQVADSREIAFQLAHSLAHASVISFRPWIYEGLAHFTQARIREQQDGRAAALDFLESRRPALAIADGEQPASTSEESLVNASDEIYYRTKAMFVWWMLRDMVGEEAFSLAVKSYRQEDDKEAAYVQRLFEKRSKRDLEPFFDDWVYRDRGLPDFKVISVYPRKDLKGTFLITIQVQNLGSAGAEVPIRIRTKHGDVFSRLEVRGKETATARVESNALPEEVIVNDGSVPESDPTNNTFTVPPPEAPK